jgi:hypothetical protein
MALDGTEVTKRFPPVHEKIDANLSETKNIINQINIADFYAVDVTIIPNTFVIIKLDDDTKNFSQVFHLVDFNNQENRVNNGSLVLSVSHEVLDRFVNNPQPGVVVELRPTGADSRSVLVQEAPGRIQIAHEDWGRVPTQHFQRWRERYRGGAAWEADAVREGANPAGGIQMWRGARKAVLGDAYMDRNSLEGYPEVKKIINY